MRRRGRRGEGGWLSPFVAGAVLIGVIALVTFLVFGNDIPFTRPYEVRIMVANAANLKERSPVRIAGVNVGKVEKVEAVPDSTTTAITVSIEDKFLPIFKDAHVKIRPRIFLEGNFFVDIQPGTPGQPKIPDQGTIPVAQTSGPV
ncbi:MAG: phospholipid/cholesterol/gamma-HCH transport system substrate-binding protein, partial [Thermoleophilaceae bacterium]|nr:phospholipid/cholesterol/gamma-HCH transport system substrate-binding protein [Thermoleophilaceae bacterium]